MCGITGFITDNHRENSTGELVRKMTTILSHRGPDGNQAWLDEQNGIAIGHARLAVIDLSASGAQPMHSSSGRYVITYNGEIYNRDELLHQLEGKGIRFRGHSDTEVLLEACAAFGVRPAVERMIGMFAFALWDKAEQVLYL